MFTAMRQCTTTLLVLATVGFCSAIIAQDAPEPDHPPTGDRDGYGVLRQGALDIGDDFIKQLSVARRGEIVELMLFEDLAIFPKTIRVEETRSGYNWVGRTPTEGVGNVMLSVEEGLLVGTVWLESAVYSIHGDGGGGYVVDQVDTGAFRSTHGSDFEDDLQDKTIALKRFENPRRVANMLKRAANYNQRHARLVSRVTAGLLPGRVLTRLPEPGSRVDILIAITGEADDWLDRNGYPQSIFDNLVLKANESLSGSGIGTQLNLVGVAFVEYTEADDKTLKTDRSNLRGLPVDQDLQVLHELRDLLRADIVSLLVRHPPEDGRSCGRAIRLKGPAASLHPVQAKGPSETVGFNVTNIDCAVLGDSLTHEIAHNFGAAHDKYRFDKDVAAAPSGAVTPAIPGAHGFFLIEPNVRTLMAYPDFCVEVLGQAPKDPANPGYEPCPIIPWFSNANPLFTYLGSPLGIVFFGAAADNAAVMNVTAQTVANFRHAYIP